MNRYKGKKNDYSMTFYNNNERTNFLEYVHDTDKAIKWIDRNNIPWSHAMVYNRRSRDKIDRLINPSNPPKKNNSKYIVYKDNEIFKEDLDHKTAYNLFIKMKNKFTDNLWFYKEANIKIE